MPRKISMKKAKIELTMKKDDNDTYWVKRIWNASKPIWLVIGNYPSNVDLMQVDLTTMLVQNNMVVQEAGGMIIGNLFTKPVKHPSDKSLAGAFADDSTDELVKVAQEVDVVLFATGSLVKKSKIAAARMESLLLQLKDGEPKYKIKQLISGERNLPMHPLALQREGWTVQDI